MSISDEIQTLLNNAVKAGVVTGVTAGITMRDGTVFSAAAGRMSAANAAPMRVDSIFWIASMTKAITSIAAMQLVENGMIELDGPVADLLPELKDLRILEGFQPSGEPVLRKASQPVTLAQLLSHSSGFAEHVWHADTLRYLATSGTPPTSSGQKAALMLPLTGEPGRVWQYGISHDWAGRLIEKASGLPLDAYFRHHIFEPIGMPDSGYVLSPAQESRRASVHRREPDGRLTPIERAVPEHREYWPGGGSLYSTLHDYLAFTRMLLDNGRSHGKSVLKPETVERLAQNWTGNLPVSRLSPAIPALSNPVEFLPAVRKCWGLGFMVNLDDMPGQRRAGSMAWAGLGNTYYWIDRASGVAGVLLTQILPFADPAVLTLFEAFEKAVYAGLPATRGSQ